MKYLAPNAKSSCGYFGRWLGVCNNESGTVFDSRYIWYFFSEETGREQRQELSRG
jgi:hypothetical protein